MGCVLLKFDDFYTKKAKMDNLLSCVGLCVAPLSAADAVCKENLCICMKKIPEAGCISKKLPHQRQLWGGKRNGRYED